MRWLLIRHPRRVLRECEASDIREARAKLMWRTGDETYVTSALSFALGDARPLDPRKCGSCGVRDHQPGKSDCQTCERQRRAEADQVGIVTGAHAERIRQSNIERGIARRAGKRGTTQQPEA